MNQEQGDCVATYLGLQGFGVVSVERSRHPVRGPVKVVRVVRRSGEHECPECGRRHAAGLFTEAAPIRLRDCSIGDLETYLEVRPMRLACCGGTRVERLPFAMPGFRMTRRFFERIAALCTRLPVEAVAQMAKHSWATVARVDGRAIELALGDRTGALADLRWIGVDEVSRTGGRVYFTIVTDLKSGRVVWIGDGKGRRGLLPFLRALGAKGRRRIQGVVSDLGYQSIVASRLPRAVHILDRFHIVQWVNEALTRLRRRLFSGAPREELGRTLKVKKWLLLSARESLEHKDKLLLKELMELNQPLYQAYLLKEQLRGILRHPWTYFGVLRGRLHEWIVAALGSGLGEFEKVALRLAQHLDAVIAGSQQRSRRCASRPAATATPSTSSSRSSSAARCQTTHGRKSCYELTEF
ncbi:MAG: ISL3 family transposase [Candidatus Eisenbacteria bacterium]|nr:ISL3 family transposase [Candidatus Eisenbacteria bacterium]